MGIPNEEEKEEIEADPVANFPVTAVKAGPQSVTPSNANGASAESQEENGDDDIRQKYQRISQELKSVRKFSRDWWRLQGELQESSIQLDGDHLEQDSVRGYSTRMDAPGGVQGSLSGADAYRRGAGVETVHSGSTGSETEEIEVEAGPNENFPAAVEVASQSTTTSSPAAAANSRSAKSAHSIASDQEEEMHPRKDLEHVIDVLGISKEVMEYVKDVSDLLGNSTADFKEFTKDNANVFTMDDIEQIDMLKKWNAWKQYAHDGPITINWTKDFTRKSIDEFRYENMLTEELECVFKELGISKQVQTYLKNQGVTNVVRLVKKTRQEYEQLIMQQQRRDEALSERLTMSDVKEIDHFKSWCTYEFVGRSLPRKWTESYDRFSKHPPTQSELNMRHILQVLGTKSDGVEFLLKEGICSIAMLVDESKNYLKKDGSFDENGSWKSESSPLSKCDAQQIIKFMRWYNFYVKGNRISPNWITDFTRVHFEEFDQYFLQTRKDLGLFNKLLHKEEPTGFHHKLFGRNQLLIAKEEKHFKNHLDEIARKGKITPAQRYHLQQYYNKKGMVDMIRGIKANMDNGNENIEADEKLVDFLQQEAKSEDDREGKDLMDSKDFCKYFFSAVLVLVLLGMWFYTTVYFMMETMEKECYKDDLEAAKLEKCVKLFGGYATFIHNITFGLVTAVVVQQLGDSSDKKSSLYSRFLPIYQRQVKKVNEMRYEHGVVSWNWFSLLRLQLRQLSMAVILWSTRLYVLCWIGLGAASLIFGFVVDTSPANPIFTTGQTWLGISITTGYTFFGVNDQQEDAEKGGADSKDPKHQEDTEKRGADNKGSDSTSRENQGNKSVISDMV